MKGITKLFPIAVALTTLASCNSDDLSVFGPTEKAPDNSLSFTIESVGDDATRAGIVGTPTDVIKQIKFKWVAGDVIRVYDNSMSEWNKFTYNDASYQDGTIFDADAQNNTSLTYNLAIYPADEVEAVYMDKDDKSKKHIEMTLRKDYTYDEKTDFTDPDGRAGYRCDMPMYGNVTNVSTALGGNQMNFLTAWTRIYLRDLPADARYIALVSGGTDQPLTGRFCGTVTYDATGKPTGSAPILATDADFKPTWGNVVYAKNPYAFASTTNPYQGKTSPFVADSAAICFPFLAEQVYDKLTVYALTDPSTNIDDVKTDAEWMALVASDKAFVIASRDDIDNSDKKHTFFRKDCWTVRYTEPLLVDVSEYAPLTPGKLGEIIAGKAKTAINELKVVLYASGSTKPVLFSSEGYAWNHVTTIPKMDKGANITIDMSDHSMKLYKAENWTINGDEFTGKLTIIQGEDATSDISGLTAVKTTAKIEVNLPKAKVHLISGGGYDVHNVEIQQCESFTIGDDVTTMNIPSPYSLWVRDGEVTFTKGVVAANVSCAKNEYDNTYPSKLTVNGGAQVTNLNVSTDTDINLIGNGTSQAKINNILLYTQRDGVYTKLANDIDIYSEGKAYIRSIYTRSTTAPVELKFVTIKSKLLEESDGVNATADLGDAINSSSSTKDNIYTAAQLQTAANSGITAATTIMADEIDLNNLEWVGGNLGANVSGYNHNATTKTWKTGTEATVTYPTKTKKNVIKNLTLKAKSQNGLFGTATSASIAGLEVSDVTYSNTTATAYKGVGALIGELTPTATSSITNVKVSGLSVTSKAGTYVGGLIGEVKTGASVDIYDAKVTATLLKARAFVGGLIGGISAGVTTVNIQKSKADVKKFELLLADGTSTLYPVYAGTFASFIGGTENNPTIALNIIDSDYGTPINKATKGNGDNVTNLRFGANGTSTDVPFFGGNPWIGFCGLATGTSNTTLTVWKLGNGSNATKFAYEATKMVQTRGTLATAGDITSTFTAASTGSTITYDGSANSPANPNQGRKYGTTIYNQYDTSSLSVNFLGYDNTYVDGITIN